MTLYRTKKISKGQRFVLKTIARFTDMSIGQKAAFITRNRELIKELLGDIRFEAVIQPLYDNNTFCIGHAHHRGFSRIFP
jgi:hypothetical protein